MKVNKPRKLVNFLAGATLALSAFGGSVTPAAAAPQTLTTLSMQGLTNNNATNTAIGVAQLTTEVQCDSAASANQVSFIFRNSGSSEIKIHEVYFDDDLLLKDLKLRDADDSVNGVLGEPGVDYSPLANPANVPGANGVNPAFATTTGFSADVDTPQPNNKAVGPGESLSVFFTLMSGKSCSNVMSDLQTGKLRIAQHVGSFPDGGSESFINNPAPVPPPANTAPKCEVSGNVFTITDAEGLGTITGTATNVTTSPALPYNANGATSATITASIVDQYANASLQLTVADKDGLTTNCNFSKAGDTPPPPPPPVDTTKPYCVLYQQIKTPVAKLIVHVQDAQSGLKEIKALKATNLTLDPVFSTTQPYNANGTKDLIVVTATKINQALSAQLQLRVTDVAGNYIDCDPVITTAVRGTGAPVDSETWTITKVERWITLDGTAGTMSIKFNVNGKTFAATVREGERKVIDIDSALVAGNNSVSLRSSGRPGSEVDVMIADEVAPAK